MVQLMTSNKKSAIKLELDHVFEDQLGPLHKRCKRKQSSEVETAALFNPLDEPSPLGLRLKKTPSFLDLIQMRLGQENDSNKRNTVSASTDKLKASNFPASLLRIGTWEYRSRYEGDLVAKCYFAKHKLVWEVLDGGLKNKIEIQWSDIVAINASYDDDITGTLDVVLARQPLFFRETNPQPRKHTLWQATSDFTGGQASIHRQHFLQCPPGLLGKHFEKLIQCDPRLNFLSQQPEISIDSPFFESRVPVFNESDASGNIKREDAPIFFTLHGGTSSSGAQSTSSNNGQEHVDPSHRAVINTCGMGDIRNAGAREPKLLNQLDQIKVPGIHPSMSVSDFVNHIGNHISEQITSGNSTISSDALQGRDILEEITQYLFSDTQLTSTSDEQMLMSRVNSLCCLLQKDYAAAQNLQAATNTEGRDAGNGSATNCGPALASELEGGLGEASGCKQPPAMSRKDSVAELLHNLPRIASLPQFLFNFSEDTNFGGR